MRSHTRKECDFFIPKSLKIRLSDDLYYDLKTMCKQKDVAMSVFTRRLLRHYLKHLHEKEKKGV